MAGNNVETEWLKGLGVTQDFGSSLSTVPENQTGIFDELERSPLTSSTLKVSQIKTKKTFLTILYISLQRNTKMEMSKSDLLKLVSCFEGEIQARDIVIAALKVLYLFILHIIFVCSLKYKF